MKKVLVMGGGVAGLTVAHELAERGYKVTIYDRNPKTPGGKARTEPAITPRVRQPDGSFRTEAPLPWNSPWPGEHGFRFFPGFYKHVPDTMRRIPYPGNPCGVLDNLVSARQGLMAPNDFPPFPALVRSPRTLQELKAGVQMPQHYKEMGLTDEDFAHFLGRVWQMATSCKERRIEEYGRVSWWDFIDASSRSWAYQTLLGIGLSRNAVATQATVANSRTIGDVMISLMFNMTVPGETADRVLVGPTNESWIDPWLMYLQRSFGVEYVMGATVKKLHFAFHDTGKQSGEGVLTGVTIRRKLDGKWVERIERADRYVSALPVEILAELLEEERKREGTRGAESYELDQHAAPKPPKCILDFDQSLEGLLTLKDQVNWMTGIQFYLIDTVDIIAGHINCLDSPWAITALSQLQFWPSVDMSQLGDGKATCIISADISNWNAKGSKDGKVPDKTAKQCTPDEIAEEAWHQLIKALNHPAGSKFKIPPKFHAYWLDDAIVHTKHGNTNRDPLLVNLINSWPLRPKAHTRLSNFFIAGDFVQTNVDFASMESANEAGRRAANSVLARDDYKGDLGVAEIWDVHSHKIFWPLQQIDAHRYAKGMPWSPTRDVFLDGVQEIRGEIQEAAVYAKEAVRVFDPLNILSVLKEGTQILLGTPPSKTADEKCRNIVARNAGRVLVPAKPWLMYQEWTDLLFIHNRVDPDVLRALLPPELEPDTFDGSAWVSLVPMVFADAEFTIPSPISPAFGFPELNLRTYVTYEGKPGLFFFNIEIPSKRAIAIGQSFGLPYRDAAVVMRQEGDTTHFSCRRAAAGEAALLECSYTHSGEGRIWPEDSLAHFLCERYVSFNANHNPDGSWSPITSGTILHDPWISSDKVQLQIHHNNYWEKQGLTLMTEPPPGAKIPEVMLPFYSKGTTVVAWAP